MKEFSKSTLDELVVYFLEELELYKDSFPEHRYSWMKHMSKDTTIDKIYTISGYLMAMNETGNQIGYLKCIIEFMIEKRK